MEGGLTNLEVEMNLLVEYGAVVGLGLNLIGAIVIAASQSRLILVINGWLLALDFYVETFLAHGPVVRFEGWDKHMERQVPRTRKWSFFGWMLIVVGAALQIPAALPK
jgi:hypothetical protein